MDRTACLLITNMTIQEKRLVIASRLMIPASQTWANMGRTASPMNHAMQVPRLPRRRPRSPRPRSRATLKWVHWQREKQRLNKVACHPKQDRFMFGLKARSQQEAAFCSDRFGTTWRQLFEYEGLLLG